MMFYSFYKYLSNYNYIKAGGYGPIVEIVRINQKKVAK